tara:strand:- start:707 stop:1207 length:501 start_codon:yes stop_codon:yes gene_type:complete
MCKINNINIRLAIPQDYEKIWDIFHSVIKTGDTYVFDPETPKQHLNKYWVADYIHTYVAEINGNILGTYILKPNQVDLGSHIANGSYMVHPEAHGKAIGKTMCEHSLKEAQILGFNAIQFNSVVSTNMPAIHLWKKYGFSVIGTIPDGFNHSKLGYVDTLIMYKKL